MEAVVPLLTLRLQYEQHVVQARQRARELAVALGFERQDQVRLATATSELARNAFRYARLGVVEFRVRTGAVEQVFEIAVSDAGPGIAQLQEVLDGRYQSQTGLGRGLIGTRQLMDVFAIETGVKGTRVVTGKRLPPGARAVTTSTAAEMLRGLLKTEVDPFGEVERQNQELLRTLAELREKQEQLAELNRELEDTNRGVVALHAELEQNANDLRRVSDLKTSFLSNLSHEFRTPLNSILGLCQILRDGADGELSAEQGKQVGYIQRSASELSELVNDLLDMAKVEAGKVDIRPRSFEVEDMFAALRGVLRSLLTNPEVVLQFEAAENLPTLWTDEPKLSQVLRNLLANALKFTERGSVRMEAQQDGGAIVFRVSDTGIGIAPEDQERIFEEFTQIESPIQSRVRGTGLGLPLARRLAELLGGSLTVESARGEGSTFTVRLPKRYGMAVPPPVVMADEVRPATRVAEQRGAYVLIVEDNVETRFIHQAALRGSQYAVRFARTLEEARAEMSVGAPEAVVLDRMLDGVDALPFIREVRSAGYGGPMLVLSVMEDRQAPLMAGADAFLPKPVAAGMLRETLTRLLRRSSVRTVMLVDDDEINRYLLREALAGYGFEIVEARSGREALRLALEQPVAAIFLDLAMPGMSGMETLRELRANAATEGVAVIVHSSKELTDEDEQAMERAQALYFPKRALTEVDAVTQLRAVLTRAGVL